MFFYIAMIDKELELLTVETEKTDVSQSKIKIEVAFCFETFVLFFIERIESSRFCPSKPNNTQSAVIAARGYS